MSVICLVDADGDAKRIVRHLSDGINDTAGIFFAVVGRYHIKTVADAEQCGLVNFR